MPFLAEMCERPWLTRFSLAIQNIELYVRCLRRGYSLVDANPREFDNNGR